MKCYSCEQTARGICRFCGRALCEDHMQNRKPYILTIYVGKDHTPKAVVVEDALYCGECKPRAEPVPMPEIY